MKVFKKPLKNGNTVRITGGFLKGRKIKTPGAGTHPMGERERLAIFNVLGNFIIDTNVLDLYAGSGALGIEAISRGAKTVKFVDKNRNVINTIKESLAELSITENSDLVCTNINTITDAISEKFPLIFADPPYDDYDPEVLGTIAELLEPGGILVLSHPDKPMKINGLKIIKTSKYARAFITYYQKEN